MLYPIFRSHRGAVSGVSPIMFGNKFFLAFNRHFNDLIISCYLKMIPVFVFPFVLYREFVVGLLPVVPHWHGHVRFVVNEVGKPAYRKFGYNLFDKGSTSFPISLLVAVANIKP